jgi:sulfatase maturation enzyme AslB (radical SAM superfamily)
MINPPQYKLLADMEASSWLTNIKEIMKFEQWPVECHRCKQTENINQTSIRLNAITFDKKQTQTDYLIVGGVLDNICNSACQTCNENLSTKIGSLLSKNYAIVDNTNKFWSLPQDRIVHLDLNGGEPSASKNYKQILSNLPSNVKSVRINTNCSTVISELENILAKGIEVVVTVSLDGIGAVHDYVRWPIQWDKFYKNLMTYKNMPINLNLWTTVSSLNINDLPNIVDFASSHNIDHSWALLNSPDALDIKYDNCLTQQAQKIDHPIITALQPFIALEKNNQRELNAYITKQDQLRNINIMDYIKFD